MIRAEGEALQCRRAAAARRRKRCLLLRAV